MALQGTLETFSLPEVLQLLSSTQKSGCLRLSGSRGAGSVWVREGAIVSSEADGAAHADGPVEVVFELLRFEDGDFVFDEGGEPDVAGEAQPVSEVLDEASGMLDEWRDIEQVVPSARHWVSLVAELPGEEITLSAARWKALVAVGGGATVDQLGDQLELGELPVARVVKDLTEQGLVEIGEPPADLPAPGTAPSAQEEPAAAGSPEGASAPVDGVGDAAPAAGQAGIEIPEPDSGPVIQAVPEPEVEATAEPQLDRFDPGGLVVQDTATPEAETETEPAPVAEEPVAEAPTAPGGIDLESATEAESEPGEAAEIARQLANLSPKAARAVAAAAKATTEEERDAALAEVEASDDQINRDLLLKFLGTVS